MSPADLTGWRDPRSSSKWAPFFRAVGEHAEVLEVLRPPLPARRRVGRALAHGTRGVVPDVGAWTAWSFRARSRLLERQLRAWDGEVDLVLQLQTLHAPGTRPRRYAICTDGTHALLERHDASTHRISPERARRWQELEREVATGAEVVLCWSEFARRSFVEDYGCDPGRVVVSGAGANMVLDTPPDRSGLPPRALFLGYEFERKGGPSLLEAWAEVEREVPGAELVVAGPTAPVPSRARNVTWLGRVDRATVARLLRDSTVFVLPSVFEPFGLVFLEAMGHGLPVVASRCCAMPELVTDGVTGALVAPGDAPALAAALVDLLRDPARAAAMGQAGHDAVLARHTWGHVGERMARALGVPVPAAPPVAAMAGYAAPARSA